jgi:hypothetical protein
VARAHRRRGGTVLGQHALQIETKSDDTPGWAKEGATFGQSGARLRLCGCACGNVVRRRPMGRVGVSICPARMRMNQARLKDSKRQGFTPCPVAHCGSAMAELESSYTALEK